MENVSAILKDAGMDLTNVVKTTIFMKDMNNFSAMNEVYGSFLQVTFQLAKLFKYLDYL